MTILVAVVVVHVHVVAFMFATPTWVKCIKCMQCNWTEPIQSDCRPFMELISFLCRLEMQFSTWISCISWSTHAACMSGCRFHAQSKSCDLQSMLCRQQKTKALICLVCTMHWQRHTDFISFQLIWFRSAWVIRFANFCLREKWFILLTNTTTFSSQSSCWKMFVFFADFTWIDDAVSAQRNATTQRRKRVLRCEISAHEIEYM